jgi:hypothetical protein
MLKTKNAQHTASDCRRPKDVSDIEKIFEDAAALPSVSAFAFEKNAQYMPSDCTRPEDATLAGVAAVSAFAKLVAQSSSTRKHKISTEVLENLLLL